MGSIGLRSINKELWAYDRKPIYAKDIPNFYSAIDKEVDGFEKNCFSNFRRLLIEKDLK